MVQMARVVAPGSPDHFAVQPFGGRLVVAVEGQLNDQGEIWPQTTEGSFSRVLFAPLDIPSRSRVGSGESTLPEMTDGGPFMGSARDCSPDLTRASGLACPAQAACPPLLLASAVTLPYCSSRGTSPGVANCAWPTACLSNLPYLPTSPITSLLISRESRAWGVKGLMQGALTPNSRLTYMVGRRSC